MEPSTGVVALTTATSVGMRKLCLSASSGAAPQDDDDYEIQHGFVNVTSLSTLSFKVDKAHPTRIVGGVENIFILTGSHGNGDYVSIMSSSVVGCTDIQHITTITNNILRYTLPLGVPAGEFKLCVAPSSALNHAFSEAYIDQQMFVTAIANAAHAMSTSHAHPFVVIRHTDPWMTVTGTVIVNDRLALIPGANHGCQDASTNTLVVVEQEGSPSIHLPGYNAGSYAICHCDAVLSSPCNQDIHYVRQTTVVVVSLPTLTSMQPLKANPHVFVHGHNVHFSLTGTMAATTERIAILVASTNGCTGASSVAASLGNPLDTVFFPSLNIACVAPPCDVKVCYSSSSNGGDNTFSDQGLQTTSGQPMQLVMPSVLGSVCKQTVGSTTTHRFVHVAPTDSYVSMSNDDSSGCRDAAESSYKRGPLVCSSSTHCLQTRNLPSDLADRSLCYAAAGTGGDEESDYVKQHVVDVGSAVWEVRQNLPQQLRTIGGARVRTIHAGRSDGFLYIVKHGEGNADGIVKYARSADGSDQGNLLDTSTGLNQPWGFVSDASRFFVSENGDGANKIRSWTKSSSSPVPAVNGESSRTYLGVCDTGKPRSLSVTSTAMVSDILYYVCSDGTSSKLRSLDISSEIKVTLKGFSGEIKDMVMGEGDGYAYVALPAGINRVLLSSGASELLMPGYDYQYVMSLAFASGRLFFVDYAHNIDHLGLFQVDVSSTSIILPTPLATLDYSDLEKDAGTPFVDVYLCGNSDGTEFYLQQSWGDPNESYESVLARVKKT